MERFSVVYRLLGTEEEAGRKARDICLEQTVEFPEELLASEFIRREIVGRIEEFELDRYGAVDAGGDTVQANERRIADQFGDIIGDFQ